MPGISAQAKDGEEAAKLLAEIEPLLPTVADSNYSHETALAEVWVRVGQPDRAVRILSDDREGSLFSLLTIATKYPEVAADFRRRAWAQAERRADPLTWSLIVHDATDRTDADTAAQAAQRMLATGNGTPERRIRTAELLLKVGRRELAREVIGSWQGWTAQAHGVEYTNLAKSIVRLLAELGKDDEIELAADKVTGVFAQSGTYSVGAEKLLALGRSSQAARLEAKAIEIAVSAPYTDMKSRWERDSAFHNLALMRSRRGDARGAIELASQINNEKREREVMS